MPCVLYVSFRKALDHFEEKRTHGGTHKKRKGENSKFDLVHPIKTLSTIKRNDLNISTVSSPFVFSLLLVPDVFRVNKINLLSD